MPRARNHLPKILLRGGRNGRPHGNNGRMARQVGLCEVGKSLGLEHRTQVIRAVPRRGLMHWAILVPVAV